MDGRMVGLIGAIVGSLIGIMGGVIGTYFGIKNTNGPRERAFVVRAAVLCWIGVTGFLACLFLLPRSWQLPLWFVYLPLQFLFVRWTNAGQVRTKVEDAADANVPGGRAVGL